LYPIISRKREAIKHQASETQAGATAQSAETQGLRFSKAALFTGVVVVLLAVALWQSRNFGHRAGLFPWVIGTPTLLLALLQLVKDLKKKPKSVAVGEEGVRVSPDVANRRTVVILSWTVGFFLAIWLLGFPIAVPLTMLAYLKLAGKEKWPMALIVTFCTWAFFYGLFERMLNVPFPEGLLVSLFKSS
ncbi:MAG TPA: tripartite tricarboxylate transporter TctB family protein, partial [Candidatus Binatia bacterium]|nr:tripartite tricarboxylate transporter TctB family protein [Candidatus Binatia bacterium]